MSRLSRTHGVRKKRNFKIEAFKHRVDLNPNYAEKTWEVLEHAIHEFHHRNVSSLSFKELCSFATLSDQTIMAAMDNFTHEDLTTKRHCVASNLISFGLRWRVLSPKVSSRAR